METVQETVNRARKAAKIAAVITQHNGSMDQALALPEAGWSMAAELAGVKIPSAATRDVVVELLRPAAPFVGDPFAGFPGES